ncbi:uncharacterized protein LOC124341404 [Daphnia pulicaria]|uniref:uncharacterized protein LOC124341404 n=1 Tax=Daphnia pulicaria TaxID=35523 RepID=UPI001EECD786|nr:uncharacterized protein LOC124341404 [Daphnia pulicaria]
MPYYIITHMIKHQEIYPTRGEMQLVAVVPLSRFFIMNISVCFLEKSKQDPTDIFEPMLDFVHHRRGTSTNVLLHPYLQDSSSFTASVLLMLLVLLHNFSCFTGELDHFRCCDTCSHSPRDYGQVPHNSLIFVDYLLVIYLR